MPTYYKYAERNADSQVNWAEIGKGVSDMIKEETDIRVQKRAAIDESTRQFQNKLAAAPQGEFQDGNKFTNNFAHDMMQQQLIDTRLLKSGQMKLQDFTLRRQNYIDGTNQLFDLQKLYQDNYKSTMEGVNNGDLQAMNTYNMSNIEGFSDFSKSKAIINPYTGIINVGMMKANSQGVMELTNDVAPVNVLRGKILSKIPTFKVEEAMNNTVAKLGKDIDYIYQAATTSGAGSVTKLLGIGAFEDLKREHPEIKNLGDYKGVIDNANSAIEKTMDGYFADPYHISSVLTQNTGKYHFDSYTYDKDIATKDPSKLLLKINPNTGLGTLDEKAPNYKTQVTEARDWVKSQLLSKLDKERSLTVTPQAQLQERRAKTGAEMDREDKEAEAVNYAKNLNYVLTGNADQVDKAVQYFRGLGVNMDRDTKGVYVTNKEGEKIPYEFGKSNAVDLGGSLIGGANPNKLPEDLILKNLKKFAGNKPINLSASAKGIVEESVPQTPIVIYSQHIDKTLTPSVIPEKATEVEVKNALNEKLNDIGITVSSSLLRGNSIYLKNNDGKESPVFNLGNKKEAMENMKKWIKSNPSENLKDLIQSGVVPSGTTTPAGAPAPNSQGVGSKYGG